MIQYLSLFSGIGAFEKALDRLGVSYNLVNYCEIDKYASKSYSAVHGVPESLNLGDVTKVDTGKLPHIDMVSYGFPCQDISLAGKQKGLFNEDGTHTRSGLFFEALRIIEDTNPKVAIAENVKNLTGKKFREQFKIVLDSLEQAGYNNYWQVLNAKDYGIPQNRERVFIVSIRKDVDTGRFKFPEPFELKLRLKDLLESAVDEKFYLSEKFMNYVTTNDAKQREKGNGFRFSPTDGDTVAKTIRTGVNNKMDDNFICEPECIEIADLNHYKNDQMNRVYSPDGIAPAQLTKSGGGRETKILNNLRIRKLTPLEYWRLQGFDDEDFYKAEKVCSNTQLYKQGGNSIVVDVLEYLFKEILEAVDMQRVEDKVIVFECDDLINLEALKEKEPELYEELLADYPAESATYVFKNKVS